LKYEPLRVAEVELTKFVLGLPSPPTGPRGPVAIGPSPLLTVRVEPVEMAPELVERGAVAPDERVAPAPLDGARDAPTAMLPVDVVRDAVAPDERVAPAPDDGVEERAAPVAMLPLDVVRLAVAPDERVAPAPEDGVDDVLPAVERDAPDTGERVL
jgi:hypothetical protein